MMSYPERPRLKRLSPKYAERLVRKALEGKPTTWIHSLVWSAIVTRAEGGFGNLLERDWSHVWALASMRAVSLDPHATRKMAIALIVGVLKRTDLSPALRPRASGGWTPVLADALNLSKEYVWNLALAGRKLLVHYGAPQAIVDELKAKGGNGKAER